MKENRYELNKQLAQMLKGGVIMDVTTPEQAKIAEEAGACAVMALERIPADIRAAGGVSRMSDPKMIRGIQEAVSIPVMAKCRIGHFVEAQILEAIEIDYIDESEVLSPADDIYHINKKEFKVPFVCGARDLGEALRRIAEGASMIRTKGEPGTGDVVQAVRHMRAMNAEIRLDDPEDPRYTLSFDLLFRGLEITTGGQRIHDYKMLTDKIAARGMTEEGMEQYLATFKHGMPPHGGLGIGLERLTMQLLGEDNVRETTLFPRDLSRLEP